MSLQQSKKAAIEAAMLRLPVAQSAVRQHGATYRQGLAAARRQQEIMEAVILGVEVVPKVKLTRFWEDWEDDIIRRSPGDREKIAQALPHRSAESIKTRRLLLGVNEKKSRAWTTAEERIIRENYLRFPNAAALAALLPGRHKNSIQKFMRRIGLSTPPPAYDSGSSVVDAIKDRCRILGYSMKDLDQLARTGRYFRGRCWQRQGGAAFVSGPLTKAVNALGGTLRVEWPD